MKILYFYGRLKFITIEAYQKMKEITKIEAQQLLDTHTNKITAMKELVVQIISQSPKGITYVNIKHRLYHIANSLNDIPKCIVEGCSSLVKWDKQNQKYTQTCGYSCSNKLTAIKTMESRKKTNNEKYGGNAPACDNNVKEKMKRTNIERYGEHYTKVHSQKSKRSLMEKYGIENISQYHINEQTSIKLSDRNYLYREHILKKQSLQVIAENLGVSDTTVNRYLKYHNIEVKRFYKSRGELELREFLKSLDIEFVTNTKKIISPLEIDIYIPSHNLAIEYNGLYWHSEKCNKTSMFHLNKTEMCEAQNIRLLHIFEDEWRDQMQQCKDTITHLLGRSNKGTYGRNVTIREIPWKQAKEFLNKYHLLKAGTCGDYRIGAFDKDNNLISVMVFGRINNEFGGNSIELKRFVTDKRNNPGVGSKMFKYATTKKSYTEVIAFVDRRWFTGLVKQYIGFEVVSKTPPSVWWTNGKYRHHRRFITKKTLIAEGFGGDISKRKILNNVGYYRIWDCGKIKLRWTK